MSTPSEYTKLFLKKHYSKQIEEIKKNDVVESIEIDHESINNILNEHRIPVNDLRSFDLIKSSLEELAGKQGFFVRFKDMQITHKIRDISSEEIGKLICFKAQVTQVSDTYPEIHLGKWICRECLREITVHFDIDGSKEPVMCHECGSKKFEFENYSKYTDTQILYLEEPIEESIGGKSCNIFKSRLKGKIIKEKDISPGDIVIVTGFLKTEKIKNKDNRRFLIETNNIEKANLTYEDLILTHEEEKKILELANSGNAYNILAECVAPSICGHETIKKSVMLQQFVNKWIHREDGTSYRETIHILLIGSPGVGKTQILRSIAYLAPKGSYVSCNTATGVGLTCAAEKSDLTGEWIAKAGVIPLTDGGTVCADELDKISADDLTKLNEALESGQISFAKAGIITTINARCSILASANPKYGRVNDYKNYMDQIEVANSSTLSRFDLIFLIKDVIDEENDRKMLKQFNNKNSTPKLGYDFIRKYISFARSYCDPVLGDDVKEYLTDFFVEARKAAIDEEKGKPITTRDYEGLQRITKALARIDLLNVAEMKHAVEAVELYKKSLESLDLSIIEAGAIQNVKSKHDVSLIKLVERIVDEYYQINDQKGFGIPEDLIKQVKLDLNLSSGESFEILKEIIKY